MAVFTGLASGVATASSGTIARLSKAVAFWGNGSHIGKLFSGDPWDTVVIGGMKLPGLCEVRGLAQLELDKKKPKGSNGVTLTVTGYEPGPFEITCTVWTSEQWDWLQDWINKFWALPRKSRPTTVEKKVRTGSNPDGSPKISKVSSKNKASQVALQIEHPALAVLGISSCVVQAVSIPEPGSFEGSKVVKIKVVEHVLPNGTVTKTAKGTANNVALAKELRPKEKGEAPLMPSKERADLGPKGPRPAPAGGSD